MSLTENDKRVLRLIKVGAENSITGAEISLLTKLAERTVRDRIKPRVTGLISAQEAMDELDIKYKTLQKWEEAGLRRYQPPLEDTRKIYYRVSDLLKFLGVENG